ncbi:MAG: hypothetical protein Q9221_008485 [Calogaya cf. arnoldii]
MVQLEEVEDQDLAREQPGPVEEEDDDYTDTVLKRKLDEKWRANVVIYGTDSSLSDDDLPSLAPSETALDRIYALKDMIPPLKTCSLFTGKGLYIVSTGSLMVFVPYLMSVMEEQQIVEMEREQKAREMGSEIMSPGAQAGGLPGAPGAKASL